MNSNRDLKFLEIVASRCESSIEEKRKRKAKIFFFFHWGGTHFALREGAFAPPEPPLATGLLLQFGHYVCIMIITLYILLFNYVSIAGNVTFLGSFLVTCLYHADIFA